MANENDTKTNTTQPTDTTDPGPTQSAGDDEGKNGDVPVVPG